MCPGWTRWCVAAREGLEPPTLALGKPCSIRLSYRAALVKSETRRGIRPPCGFRSQMDRKVQLQP